MYFSIRIIVVGTIYRLWKNRQIKRIWIYFLVRRKIGILNDKWICVPVHIYIDRYNICSTKMAIDTEIPLNESASFFLSLSCSLFILKSFGVANTLRQRLSMTNVMNHSASCHLKMAREQRGAWKNTFYAYNRVSSISGSPRGRILEIHYGLSTYFTLRIPVREHVDSA